MKSLLCLAVVALWALPASANPCQGDIEKFCKNVEPGGGRIIQCLKQNEASLSDACKKAKVEKMEKFQGLRDACAEDVTKLCGSVAGAGPGKVRRCLRDNKDKVSTACKESFKSWRHGRKG